MPQGGGALGADEYAVLRALHGQRPVFAHVAVTGLSIGAITAAVLGGAAGDPMAALDELWRHRSRSRPRPGYPRRSTGRVHHRRLLAGLDRGPHPGRYDDVVAQGIGSPRGAGLRFGTTADEPGPARPS